MELTPKLPKDLRQFAHPPSPPLKFTYPPLALSSATFLSRLKTELFKLSYPESRPISRFSISGAHAHCVGSDTPSHATKELKMR